MPPTQRKKLRGLSVLVVEDDPTHRELLQTVLVNEAARVRSVDSVAGALELVGRYVPNVIVSDMQLPDGDGCGLLRTLRQRGLRVPAIAITGYAKETDRAFEAGFQLHISKPFKPEDLVLILASVVGR